MKLFVTGGSGFVGGAVIRRFAGAHTVLAMARSDAAAEAVSAAGATPVRCDLADVSGEHMDGADVVIHAAAKVEPWGPWREFKAVNVTGTQRLLAAATAGGAERFIHIGTEAALFHGQSMRNIDESAPLAPHSVYPYSASKAMAEQAVRDANAKSGGQALTTIVLRPRLIWGPGDQTILPGVQAMIASGAFAWIGGGRAVTSSCHIDNLLHAIDLAMTRGQGGAAYFITDDEARSFRDFLTAYLATVGVTPPRKSVPAWVIRPAAWMLDRLWALGRVTSPPPISRFEAAILSADCTLRIDAARADLGYAPQVSIDDGMDALRQRSATP